METTEKMLEQAKETANDVIKGIVKKENISPADLEHLTKSVCLIEKIKAIEEKSESGYSERNSSRPEYYDGENSYRRGRSSVTGRYVSRDGGSSRDYHGGGNSGYNHYDGESSRRYNDGGGSNYSGHSVRDRMIDRLERMIDEAQNEHERKTVQEWIDRIRYN